MSTELELVVPQLPGESLILIGLSIVLGRQPVRLEGCERDPLRPSQGAHQLPVIREPLHEDALDDLFGDIVDD